MLSNVKLITTNLAPVYLNYRPISEDVKSSVKGMTTHLTPFVTSPKLILFITF